MLALLQKASVTWTDEYRRVAMRSRIMSALSIFVISKSSGDNTPQFNTSGSGREETLLSCLLGQLGWEQM